MSGLLLGKRFIVRKGSVSLHLIPYTVTLPSGLFIIIIIVAVVVVVVSGQIHIK
jgi:hypothetical protein